MSSNLLIQICGFQSRFFIVLPRIVLAMSGFHEIEMETRTLQGSS